MGVVSLDIPDSRCIVLSLELIFVLEFIGIASCMQQRTQMMLAIPVNIME